MTSKLLRTVFKFNLILFNFKDLNKSVTIKIQAVDIYLGTQKDKGPLVVTIEDGESIADALNLVSAKPKEYQTNLSNFSHTQDHNGLNILSTTYDTTFESRSGRSLNPGTYVISKDLASSKVANVW